MQIIIREYKEADLPKMIEIWNEVVDDGTAFPQDLPLDFLSGMDFFSSQTYCGVAEDLQNNEIYGLYILHPNNVGRCSHICNASYAVLSDKRGMHIGEKLVLDCINQGKKHNFGILQFNAVVSTNIYARHLYEKLGFEQLGTIPKGFRLPDGSFADICPYYKEL